jgi:prefoldin alpha subunit
MMPPSNSPAATSSPNDSGPSGVVDITTLSVPQLRNLQSRLSTELEHLTNSHAKLRAAQSKFRDCVRSINEGIVGPKKTKDAEEDKSNSILVPLTSSLYVKGRLANRDKVIVDVGTGFYIEKTASKAIDFYNRKAKELDTNLQDLEKIVQGKSSNLRVIEDVLRQKVLSGEAATSGHSVATTT